MTKKLAVLLSTTLIPSLMAADSGLGGGGSGGDRDPRDQTPFTKPLYVLSKGVAPRGSSSDASHEDPALTPRDYSIEPYCKFFDAELARGNWSGAFQLFVDTPVAEHVPGLERNLEALRAHVTTRVPSMIEGLIREAHILEARELLSAFREFDPRLGTDETLLDRVDNALVETLSQMGRNGALMGDEALRDRAYELADLFPSRKFNVYLRSQIESAHAEGVRAFRGRASADKEIIKAWLGNPENAGLAVIYSNNVLAEASDVRSLTAEVARLTDAYGAISRDWSLLDPVIAAVYEVLGVEEFTSKEAATRAAEEIRAKFSEAAAERARQAPEDERDRPVTEQDAKAEPAASAAATEASGSDRMYGRSEVEKRMGKWYIKGTRQIVPDSQVKY